MKSRFLVVGILMIVFLFVAACSSGVSEDEYNNLVSDYESMEKEYTALQSECDVAKVELANVQAEIKECETQVTTVNGYAQFLDIYVDIFREEAGIPTKFGYSELDTSEDYKLKFIDAAYNTGDNEFGEKVSRAVTLPQGAEKDKAWAEWRIHMVDRILTASQL